eukprot:TRINITY_DN18839_c0_g1_i1.p1 TRINITY_DN18839_c0_g1~~TRINITY_DN18839_c0_g1_i1.p1  ORF type:complete len:887 (-),score=187.31 TRINITY_DN18839_c0_g1_i1:213-2873(-)
MSSLCKVTRALRRQFPHVDADAVDAFVESCDGALDSDTVMALADMQREAASRGVGETTNFRPTRACTVTTRGTFGTESHGAGASVWEALSGEFEIRFEGGDDPPHVGTVLAIDRLNEMLDDACGEMQGQMASGRCGASATVLVPTGEAFPLERHESPTHFLTNEYGMHELRILTSAGTVKRCRFMVSSHLGEFAEALDHFHDAYDWVWDGGWTEEFEEAIVTLLVALDDHFEALDAALTGSVMMGDAMRSTIGPPKKRMLKYLAKALDEQDVLAVGRAVSGVRAFLLAQSLMEMFAPMLGMNKRADGLAESDFYKSVMAFERARFKSSSSAKQAETKAALARLIDTADAHVAVLHASSSGGQAQEFASRWLTYLREVLVKMRDDPEAVIHPLPFQQLRGGGGGYISDMIASMADSFSGQSGGSDVKRAHSTEALCTLGQQVSYEAAEAKVTRWAESLVDESVSFGSPMSPFEVHGGPPSDAVFAALNSVLSLGFGYVTQGDKASETSKLGVLLDRVRAALPLRSYDEFLSDRRRRERLKDVCRVIRAIRKKGQKLSLSVNTDFKGALKALREHHSDSWVGASLEAVWEKMMPEKRAFVFELWLHEADNATDGSKVSKPPKLVAADFGHPHTYGKAYYVATRFFDREARTLQPGFVLAFAEAECLSRVGFELWDLGGADASPMMQYKPQVAIEQGRSDFLRRLRELDEKRFQEQPPEAGKKTQMERRLLPLADPEAAPPPAGERVPTGVVFPDITEAELWGSAILKAREGQAKVAKEKAEKAAAIAAKQQQAKVAKKKAPKDPRKVPCAASQTPALSVEGADMQAEAKGAGSEVSPSNAKEAARQQFLSVFQRLVAEGLSQNEAAAKALEATTAAAKRSSSAPTAAA